MPVIIRAEENEDNLLECKDTGKLMTRVDAKGVIITKVNNEPDSGDLAAGECAWWYDGDVTVRFKARKKTGAAVVSGEVILD
jgi:hypothetical protein